MQYEEDAPKHLLPHLLPLLAGASRLRSLNICNSSLPGSAVTAFAGLAPLHLGSLRLSDLMDGIPSKQLGRYLLSEHKLTSQTFLVAVKG